MPVLRHLCNLKKEIDFSLFKNAFTTFSLVHSMSNEYRVGLQFYASFLFIPLCSFHRVEPNPVGHIQYKVLTFNGIYLGLVKFRLATYVVLLIQFFLTTTIPLVSR